MKNFSESLPGPHKGFNLKVAQKGIAKTVQDLRQKFGPLYDVFPQHFEAEMNAIAQFGAEASLAHDTNADCSVEEVPFMPLTRIILNQTRQELPQELDRLFGKIVESPIDFALRREEGLHLSQAELYAAAQQYSAQ